MIEFIIAVALLLAVLALISWLYLRAHQVSKPVIFAIWAFTGVFSLGIYSLTGDFASLSPDAGNSTSAQSGSAPETVIDLDQLAAGVIMVEQQVADDPQYALGWLMLARSYWLLERFAPSAEAFDRYHNLETGDTNSWLGHAQVLLALDPPAADEALDYLQRALELERNNPRALWFAGYASSLQQNYQQAIDYWQQLLPLIANDPATQNTLQQQIRNAEAKL